MPLLDLALYEWTSSFLSICELLQTVAYREQIANLTIVDSPVFIVGFWRSGTTLLHELLAQDPQFSIATTRHCMNPAIMLLSGGSDFGRHSAEKRPMDDMVITGDSPQEDEFALLALGAPSPYRMLLTPDDPTEALRLLTPKSMSQPEIAALRSILQRFLSRLSLFDRRRLLLKSPTHAFRIRTLAEWFPGSKFVSISREPAECLASNFKLWRALYSQYALGSWNDESIERFVVGAYRALADELVIARKVLPRDRLVEITFEDLVSAPENTLELAYSQLGLSGVDAARAGWRQRFAESRGYTPEHYPNSAQEIARIESVLKSCIDVVRHSSINGRGK